MEAIGIYTSPFLPEDITIEILSKVSLKSLHRLKWVSKSWFSLITSQVLNQLVNYQDLSSYYNKRLRIFILENRGKVSLDFLPNNNNNQLSRPATILDCCGGLVFCSLWYNATDWSERSYYVCNPVDKSYNQILSIDFLPDVSILDFNPLISPHYKLVFVQSQNKALKLAVYHSEKRCFEKVHVRPPPNVIGITFDRRYIALWKGNVYLHCQSLLNQAEDGTLMISGVQKGSGKHIVCKFIKYPKGRKVYSRSYIFTWKDRLRFVSTNDHEIRVWALWDNQEDEWTLEHACPCFLASIRPFFVVGLHPLQNAVFLIYKDMLFAYDLDQMQFKKNCEIEDGVLCSFSGLCVFPFSPCFAKEVLV